MEKARPFSTFGGAFHYAARSLPLQLDPPGVSGARGPIHMIRSWRGKADVIEIVKKFRPPAGQSVAFMGNMVDDNDLSLGETRPLLPDGRPYGRRRTSHRADSGGRCKVTSSSTLSCREFKANKIPEEIGTMNTRLGLFSGLALMGALSSCSPTTVVAAAGKVPEVHVITVSGHGRVDAAPDIASLSIGVDVRNSNVHIAMNEASQRMNKALSTLERVGVPKRDIQTSSLQILLEPLTPPPHAMPPEVPMMPSAPPTPAAPPSGPSSDTATSSVAMPSAFGTSSVCRVSSMLEVKLRDLSRVGDVVSLLTAAGANQAWGISYDIEERAPFQAQARAKAVQDAKARAEQLARLGDVKLGKALAIREGVGPEMTMDASYAAPMVPGVPAMGAEPGRVRVEQWVTIVYVLE